LGPKLNHNLIPQQHGFCSGRSTISCSVSFSSFIHDCLSNGAQVDIIFTDFSKAFDTVPHNLLINELDRIGIGDPLLSLFRSFLSNRKQFVKLNGVSSDLSDVISGVPQGSHLSPLLFCLYVNSIFSFLKKANFLLYADNIKILLKIETHTDCLLLSNELILFNRWVSALGLSLNINNCNVISFSRSRNPIHHPYMFNDILLQRVSIIKDLGIYYSSSLSL